MVIYRYFLQYSDAPSIWPTGSGAKFTAPCNFCPPTGDGLESIVDNKSTLSGVRRLERRKDFRDGRDV
jgi:hypothetical protein